MSSVPGGTRLTGQMNFSEYSECDDVDDSESSESSAELRILKRVLILKDNDNVPGPDHETYPTAWGNLMDPTEPVRGRMAGERGRGETSRAARAEETLAYGRIQQRTRG